MKKLLILVIAVATVIGIYQWQSDPAEPEADPTTTTVGAAFQPDPSGATFSFDGEAVALVDGKGESTDAFLGLVSTTELLDERAFGDLNGDSKDDVLVLLSQSGGGSGTFVYAAAFVSGPVGYKGSNAVFLGDRIEPTSISLSNGVATVTYLDRKEDEPFTAEPTVKTTKQFVYLGGEFQEK